MMRQHRLIGGCLIIILIGASQGLAQRKGFEFLRTHVGARASALGGAFLAVQGDVHAAYYNPAGLSTLTSRQLTFSYLNHFLDFQSGFFAYSFSREGVGRLAIASHYMNYGEFTRADELGNETGTFGAGSLLLMASFSRYFSPNLSFGISAKFIRSSIESFSSTAFAGDLGFMYSIPSQKLVLAAGLFNAGSVSSAFIETKDELPMSIRAGLSKRLEHLPLMLILEGYHYFDEEFEFVTAGEFTLTPFLYLRLSYNSIGQDQKIGENGERFAGVSIGTGVSLDKSVAFEGMFWQNLNIDYALTSAGNIGTQNRISLGISF